MIVDVHSHYFRYADHSTDNFREQAKRARAGVEVDLTDRYEEYRASCPSDLTATVVFGGKARLSGLWVNDQDLADYVALLSENLIDFLSIDLFATSDAGLLNAQAVHEMVHRVRRAFWGCLD